MKKQRKIINYEGWELKFFDHAKNFRTYQLQLIKKYLKGNVAEVGPGNGTNLNYYIKYPKKVDLFEPTKKLYLRLKANFKKDNKISVYNKKLITKKKYNVILYLDVLEHIEDDKQEIIKAYKSIKNNGYLVINVPAFSHLYSQFDKDVGHYRRYEKKDFKLILKGIKFKKISFTYYDSIGYLLSLLSSIFSLNYKKNFKKKIILWDKLIPISKVFDFLTCNNFGKSLLIVIKK